MKQTYYIRNTDSKSFFSSDQKFSCCCPNFQVGLWDATKMADRGM